MDHLQGSTCSTTVNLTSGYKCLDMRILMDIPPFPPREPILPKQTRDKCTYRFTYYDIMQNKIRIFYYHLISIYCTLQVLSLILSGIRKAVEFNTILNPCHCMK